MPDDKPRPVGVRILEKQMDEIARQIGQLARDDPQRAALIAELSQITERVRKLTGEKR